MKKLILTLILIDLLILHSDQSYLIPIDSDESLIVSEEGNDFYPNSCQIAINEKEDYKFALLVCISFKLYIKNPIEREKLTLKLDSIFLAGAFKDSDFKEILDRTSLPEKKIFNNLEELENEGFKFLIYDFENKNKHLEEEYEIDFSGTDSYNIKSFALVFERSKINKSKFLFLQFEFTIKNQFSFHDDFVYDDSSEDEKKKGIEKKEIFVGFETKSYTPGTLRSFFSPYKEIFIFKGFSKDLVNALFEHFKDTLQTDIKEDEKELKKALFSYPTEKEKEEFIKSTEGLMVEELSDKRDLLDEIKTIGIKKKGEEEKKDNVDSKEKDTKGDNKGNDKNEKKGKKKSYWGLKLTLLISVIALIFIIVLGFIYRSKKNSYKL